MTKTCVGCKLDKDLSEFNWKNKSKQIKQPRCKLCQSEYARNYYATNADQRQKQLDRIHANTRKDREWFYELKATLSCILCGEEESCCLEFHHIDPETKLFAVSFGLDKGKKKIQEEIDKCVILCANCHRKVHAGIATLPS